MVNYVLKKVNSSVNNIAQTYRERFEFAVVDFEKAQRERKARALKQKLST